MDWSSSPVIVVTGASSGIGRATVRELARLGARIGLLARGQTGLQATLAEVDELGGRGIAIPTDVSDAEAVEAAADRIEAELGPIDAWVNAAVVSLLAPVTASRPDEIRRVMEIGYLGTVHGTQSALRRMEPRGSGVIVQVGSVVAYRSVPLQSAYCAAKHAVLGFTDSLRTELLHDGSKVKLTMVQLPSVNTPFYDWARSRLPYRLQPPPPIFQPEVAARAIVDAIEHPRREVFVGAPTALAIQAQKVAPGLLDRLLATWGYVAQETDEPEDPNRRDNLFRSPEVDAGAHGRFTDRSVGDRPLTVPLTHPGWAALTAAGIAATAAVAWRAIRR